LFLLLLLLLLLLPLPLLPLLLLLSLLLPLLLLLPPLLSLLLLLLPPLRLPPAQWTATLAVWPLLPVSPPPLLPSPAPSPLSVCLLTWRSRPLSGLLGQTPAAAACRAAPADSCF
jgi:hypothetical protein